MTKQKLNSSWIKKLVAGSKVYVMHRNWMEPATIQEVLGSGTIVLNETAMCGCRGKFDGTGN